MGLRAIEELQKVFPAAKSRNALADAAGLNGSTLASWEAGTIPNGSALGIIAACGGDVRWIVSGERERPEDDRPTAAQRMALQHLADVVEAVGRMQARILREPDYAAAMVRRALPKLREQMRQTQEANA